MKDEFIFDIPRDADIRYKKEDNKQLNIGHQVSSDYRMFIDGVEILRFTKEGMYYRGKLVEIEKELEEGFRDLLMNMKKF